LQPGCGCWADAHHSILPTSLQGIHADKWPLTAFFLSLPHSVLSLSTQNLQPGGILLTAALSLCTHKCFCCLTRSCTQCPLLPGQLTAAWPGLSPAAWGWWWSHT
jgi:hypothetical protein